MQRNIIPCSNEATYVKKIETKIIKSSKAFPPFPISNGNMSSPNVINVYNVYNIYNVYTTPPSPISYGNFSFPSQCPIFTNDCGHDCPQGVLSLTINGPQIGDSLLQAKKRLERKITENAHRQELDQIFSSTSIADFTITMIWDHPHIPSFRACSNKLAFYENGVQTGMFLAEYGGGWWREGHGFLGEWNTRERVGYESGDARDRYWNPIFVKRYNDFLEKIKDAIYLRADKLSDFETKYFSNNISFT